MDMHRYVASALKDLVVDGQVIPTSFVARGETNLPLVVFNVTSETGKVFWEDDEQIIKYNVMINIFSKGNFVKIKQDDGKTALYAHMKYGSVKSWPNKLVLRLCFHIYGVLWQPVLYLQLL